MNPANKERAMPTNTNLTRELALDLIRGKRTPCPRCGEAALLPRHSHKNANTEFKCPRCGEVYKPCRLI